MYGIPPAFYQKFPILPKWYKALTTTKDRNGLDYISTMEGVKYPFFGERLSDAHRPANASDYVTNAVQAYSSGLTANERREVGPIFWAPYVLARR
jgi:hypothetical protein